jgi:hypothetical protein
VSSRACGAGDVRQRELIDTGTGEQRPAGAGPCVDAEKRTGAAASGHGEQCELVQPELTRMSLPGLTTMPPL